jgi:hypothetical protein
VTERDDHEPPGRRDDDDRGEPAAPALVEAQVESARAQVFRAYVRAREQAAGLAGAELEELDELAARRGRRRRAS